MKKYMYLLFILLFIPTLGYSQSEKFIYTNVFGGIYNYEQDGEGFRRMELPQRMIENQEAADLARNGNRLRNAAIIFNGTAVIGFTTSIILENEIVGLSSLLVAIVGGIINLTGITRIVRSVDLYNSSLIGEKAYHPKLDIGATSSGFGLTLTF